MFLFYGTILVKFYQQKRKIKTLNVGYKRNYHKYSKIIFNLFQKRIYSNDTKDKLNVELKRVRTVSETGEILRLESEESQHAPRKDSTMRRLSAELSFHVSFVKSSFYVLGKF